MFYLSLIINIRVYTKFSFKCYFNFVARAEVDEIINKEAKVDQWFAVNDGAGEDAWCVRKRFEGLLCLLYQCCGTWQRP